MAQSTIEQPSIDFGVGGMTCASCATRVQRVLGKQPGVEQAEVAIRPRGGQLDQADGVDEPPRQAQVADREVADGAHRARAVVGAIRHLELAHRVALHAVLLRCGRRRLRRHRVQSGCSSSTWRMTGGMRYGR